MPHMLNGNIWTTEPSNRRDAVRSYHSVPVLFRVFLYTCRGTTPAPINLCGVKTSFSIGFPVACQSGVHVVLLAYPQLEGIECHGAGQIDPSPEIGPDITLAEPPLIMATRGL